MTLPGLSAPVRTTSDRLEQALLRLSVLSDQLGADLTAQPAQSGSESHSPAGITGVSAVKTSASDRRAFPRRESSCRVAVCRLQKEDWSLNRQQIEWRLHATTLKGTLSDLSLKGAAILLPQSLSLGETVMLRLFCPRRDHHLDQQATIVGVVPEPEGQCRLMCQFHKRLSLEQISVFSRFLNHLGWV